MASPSEPESESEVIDHLMKIYEANERLSQEQKSTQKAIASTKKMIQDLRAFLEQFIKDELKRRRERVR